MEKSAASVVSGTGSATNFSSADGTPLAGTLAPGSGLPVVLAHGFGQTRQSWSATQARLSAAGHPSLAWDMRGHGESGRNLPGRRYAAEQFVDDQLAAAGTMGPMPVLVGASMGGLTGLMAQAGQRPYSALVLVDVTPRWEAAGMDRIRGFMTAFPDGFESLEQAATVIADYLPQRRARKSPAQLASLLREGGDGRLRWHWDPRLLTEFVADSHELQDALSEAATRIEVPVLLISGGRSDLVSEQTVAHFLELAPQAGHVRLPDATHMLAGDDNDAFSDALLAFLRAQFPLPVAPDAIFGQRAPASAGCARTALGVAR